MKYKLAIFDMDGTILDTLEDLTISSNYVLSEMNCPTRTTEEVRRCIGNGAKELMRQILPDDSTEEQVMKALKLFATHYKAHCKEHTRPYKGINETLENLRRAGVKTAVVSNKPDEAVKALCADLFTGLFDYALGEDPGLPKKPDRAMVDKILSELGIDKKDAVYIGDSDVDIKTAENSEMDHIIVTWGFRDENFLREEGAKVFAHDMAELEEKLI